MEGGPTTGRPFSLPPDRLRAEMAPEDPVIARILAFLAEIGIPAVREPVTGDSFLPGTLVRNGTLVFDPALPYPGDLLHEAGHIAVTASELRPGLCEVANDPAEEMAAIAWSYAAALAIGIDPAVVFHPHGYRGGSAAILENFAVGRYFGVPMLQYYGMTAEKAGPAVYPAMSSWLRTLGSSQPE